MALPADADTPDYDHCGSSKTYKNPFDNRIFHCQDCSQFTFRRSVQTITD